MSLLRRYILTRLKEWLTGLVKLRLFLSCSKLLILISCWIWIWLLLSRKRYILVLLLLILIYHRILISLLVHHLILIWIILKVLSVKRLLWDLRLELILLPIIEWSLLICVWELLGRNHPISKWILLKVVVIISEWLWLTILHWLRSIHFIRKLIALKIGSYFFIWNCKILHLTGRDCPFAINPLSLDNMRVF